jgi:Sec-independent protein translocase protein TatA
VLALGAGRLPEAGRIVGKGLRNFHRGMREARDVLSQDSESSGPSRPSGPAPSRPRRLID